jgi:outer membrane protein TolC
MKQAKLGEERLKIEIRDEISNRIEIVKLRHVVLARSKAARNASERYYRRVLEKFGRGKVSSLDMKSAIDAMAQSRQQELESLVAYNVSLLQLDLCKNELFERYNIDTKNRNKGGALRMSIAKYRSDARFSSAALFCSWSLPAS